MSRTVVLEILSADPIGPLSLTQGRTAVQGDILGNLLAFFGEEVRREYYVNDMGQRLIALCDSVRQCLQAYREGEVSEGRFDRVTQRVADELRRRQETNESMEGLSWQQECLKTLPDILLNLQRQTLERLGVKFDTWFEEKGLLPDAVDHTLRQLRESGQIEEDRGALWLRVSAGNRVLVRRDNGTFTYLAVDIAYHLSKIERGAESMIDVWGPAYHRHRERLKEALRLLDVSAPLNALVTGPIRMEKDGMPVNYLDAAILQLDPLLEHGSVSSLRYHLNRVAPEEDLALELDTLQGNDLPHPIQAALDALRLLQNGEASQRDAVSMHEAMDAALQPMENSPENQSPHLRQFTRTTPTVFRRAAAQQAPHLLSLHLNNFMGAWNLDGAAKALETADPPLQNALFAALSATFHLMGIAIH